MAEERGLALIDLSQRNLGLALDSGSTTRDWAGRVLDSPGQEAGPDFAVIGAQSSQRYEEMYR